MATDNDCPICQESLHGNLDVGCTVPCGHAFHQACYETWQTHTKNKKQQKCPCCNVTLTTFIEKIHITLPPAPAPVSTPVSASANLGSTFKSRDSQHRRQELSNQKARRSALARHQQMRDGGSGWDADKIEPAKGHVEAPTIKAVPLNTNCLKKDPVYDSRSRSKEQKTWNLKTTSVSASLQRLPSEEDMAVEQRDASCTPSSCKWHGNPAMTKSTYPSCSQKHTSARLPPQPLSIREDDVEQRDTTYSYSSCYDGKPKSKRHSNHKYRYDDEEEILHPSIVERSDFSSVELLEEEISHVTDMALRKLELSIRPLQQRQYHVQRHGSSNIARSVKYL